jgi:translation initiation factor IF-1
LSQKDLIHLQGKVIKVLNSGIMQLDCDNGIIVMVCFSGQMGMHRIKVVVGDQVQASVSPCDPSDERLSCQHFFPGNLGRHPAR